MATPRLSCGKIIPLSAAIAIIFAGCANTDKTPKLTQDSQTTIRLKPGEGEAAGPLDPNATLEALARFYEAQAEDSGRLPTSSPNSSLPKKIRPGTRTTIGKILMVHEGSRFVLINTKAGLKPPAGATVMAEGAAGSCTLRISEEQRREFLSADIVHGTPLTGDSVIWER